MSLIEAAFTAEVRERETQFLDNLDKLIKKWENGIKQYNAQLEEAVRHKLAGDPPPAPFKDWEAPCTVGIKSGMLECKRELELIIKQQRNKIYGPIIQTNA